MSRAVLVLLTIITVRGRGCDDLKKGTVSNLQTTISNERDRGFPEVFPDNYYVRHHFNASTQCHDRCCVFYAAVFLSHSWMQVLQHLAKIHLKRDFITELVTVLDEISKETSQEIPDLSVFPPVHSSPRDLLTFTSGLLSDWLFLGCPIGEQDCIFPTLAPSSPEEEEKKVQERDGVLDELYENKEEIEKRWITTIPANGALGSFPSLGHFLCALFFLKMVLIL